MTCKHCGEPIERCPIDPCSWNGGWRHAGYLSQPTGSHYCGGRSVNPIAEPAESTGTTDG
jgi:hypothetical protein